MTYWTKDEWGEWTSSPYPFSRAEVRESKARRREFFATRLEAVARFWLRRAGKARDRGREKKEFLYLYEASCYALSAARLRHAADALRRER